MVYWRKHFYYNTFACRLKHAMGFTLIEVMLTLTLFAIGIPVAAYLFSVAFKEEQGTSLHTQAAFLAAELMDEISQRRFRESTLLPGNSPDAGELSALDRRNFNDIDDYSIFSEDIPGQNAWGALTPPRDEAGNSLSNYSKFSQWVQIQNILPPTSGPTVRASYSIQTEGTTDFKLVTVKISWDSGKRDVTLYKVFAKQ